MNESFSLHIIIDIFNKIYIFDLNKLEIMCILDFPKIMKTKQEIFSISIDGLSGEFVVITNYLVVLFNINGVLLGKLDLKEQFNHKITCAFVKSVDFIFILA